MSEQNYPPPTDQLLTLGDVGRQREWNDYAALGLGPEHVDDLLRMALDEELYSDNESDGTWAPIHAWRALGQLRAERAAGPLTQLLERVDRFGEDPPGPEKGQAPAPAAEKSAQEEPQTLRSGLSTFLPLSSIS